MSVDPVSLAVTAALTAANMALTAMQTFEGPRVKGSPATLSDYGSPLNYFLGTRLLNASCFFAKPIEEERKQRKGKGGKQVSYTGYGTFAVHVADHEISGILQIWFDNHLVYDATGSSTQIYPLADDYDLESAMRVYLGTETQDPDPDMLAYIEARDGAGTCPAYRGTSYIYFERIPLELLGNRYPDVKVLAYQNGALTEAQEFEIDFVGQQQVQWNGSGDTSGGEGTGPVAFSLSGGLASTPAAGDMVIIVVSSGRYPLSSQSYHASIDGYSLLVSSYSNETLLSDFTWAAYYKFMGGVPDTEFTPTSIDAPTATNAMQVMVFRGVAPEPVASTVGVISGPLTSAGGNGTFLLAPFYIDGAIFQPGYIGDSTTARGNYVFKSFALLSSASGQAMPIVLGGECTASDVKTSGNLTTIYQYGTTSNASQSRSSKSYAIFGDEVLVGNGSTLGALLTAVAERAGLEPDEYDFSQVFGQDHAFDGFNWSQAPGSQISEALCDLFDVDLRPHDFKIQALPRGSDSQGALPSTEFVRSGSALYAIPDKSDSSLPKRVFLTYADTTAEQNPNVAMPQGGEASGGEISIDMQSLALAPTRAQTLAEKHQRRSRFGRVEAQFSLTRQRLAFEPGDVWSPSFDGEAMTMRATKVTLGADGILPTEWERDYPAVAIDPPSTGAPASGYVPDTIPTSVESEGYVLDTALLVDSHDQTAPLAYLAAGPAEPGIWTGADYAVSDTGALDSYTLGWGGIASGNGSVIGTVAGTLPDIEDPWVVDNGSSISVTINIGELTAATLDQLLLDPTLNLAAIESGDGWELVQFMTPTLTGTRTYTITGFIRGVRGTEWATAGHTNGDTFILLDNAKIQTIGAGEIADTDYYIVSTTGQAVDQDTAFALEYTGASHKPYAPVHGYWVQNGADWELYATRRTRIGGATLDGQDVPLGEASESYAVDIYDGATFKRTITGTSFPLTYLEADQTTDFGSPLSDYPDSVLVQVDPTLNLRGYELEFEAVS